MQQGAAGRSPPILAPSYLGCPREHLLALLHPRLKPDWQTIANTSIRLSDVDQPTIRVPDLTVIRADVDPDERLF